jgi:hypothetical protein
MEHPAGPAAASDHSAPKDRRDEEGSSNLVGGSSFVQRFTSLNILEEAGLIFARITRSTGARVSASTP